MPQTITLSVGRLLSRNEKLTTAKFNAVVKSIVIDISGSVGTSDLVDGTVTPIKASPGAWFDATAVFDGSTTYTAAYAPVLTSYVDGLWLTFKADTTNLGACYFNAGGGAKPLVKHGGSRQLDKGDVVAKGRVTVRYNTTLISGGCWEVMSLPGRPVETTPWQPASVYAAGEAGVMPAFPAGKQNYYLRGDGTLHDPVAEAVALTNGTNTYNEIYKASNFI